MQSRSYWYQYELNGKNIVRVEAISDTTPPEEPTIDDFDGFPRQWPKETVQFAAGSIIYVTTTGDVYMANEEGKFSKIQV